MEDTGRDKGRSKKAEKQEKIRAKKEKTERDRHKTGIFVHTNPKRR